ncbi:U32 family peptidase [Candidatus Woesearchaeota archaeon]|nr:U32 family peptidase [Candidatus Woesearchaeota archaeon]
MVELLLPAGNFENLKTAVENGADAVYLGIKRFNARVKAGNFSIPKLKEAISYAHKNGVKVYVTLNTLIKNNEINDFFNAVKDIYLANADAVIIQEISFAKIIKENFPELEVHASTQARIQNLQNLKYFDRVILPRELSKEEIIDIKKNSKLPIEIFVQGALCFCISGLCLMSSVIGRRSGNRGICAQPCRKKYNDDYLMSMKDLSLIKKIDEIREIGVDSIKIEGRLRSKEYVKYVTQIYRKALDNEKITEKDIQKLNSVFYRKYTEGFYSDDKEKISEQNITYPQINHEIYDFKNKKKEIKIKQRLVNKIKLPEIKTKKSELGFYVKVDNIEGVKQAVNFEKVKIIFYNIDNKDFLEAKRIIQDSKKKLYAILPTIMNDVEIQNYKNKIQNIKPDGVLLNNYIDLGINQIYNYGMNAFNDIDLEFFGTSIISPELGLDDLINFKNKNFLVLIHGNLVVMTTKNKLPDKLKYDEKFTFPVVKENDYYKILNSKQIALLENIKLLNKNGINQYYFDLDKNVKKWLDIYTKIINGDELNFKKLGKGFTLGHFKKGV